MNIQDIAQQEAENKYPNVVGTATNSDTIQDANITQSELRDAMLYGAKFCLNTLAGSDSDLKPYLQHLPTCATMQDWSEYDFAMANTPDNFRDESFYKSLEETNKKRNTCTCGLEEHTASAVAKAVGEKWVDANDIARKLEELNPYPIDVFTEPTDEEWKGFAPLCTENGIVPDRIMGKIGRMVWNNCISNLMELLPSPQIKK